MSIRIATTAAFTVGLLGLSACGGGDDATVEEAPSQTSAAATESEAVEPDVAPETAVEPEGAAESAAQTEAAPEAGSTSDGGPLGEALLTEEEFPLEGFTRGDVTAESGSEALSEEDAAGALDDLTKGQDLSAACEEALQFTDVAQADVGEGSAVDFTIASETDTFPVTVGLAVAPLEGDSPLEALSKMSSECDSFTLEEEGQSMTMTFNSLDDIEGTEIMVEASGIEFGLIIGGVSNDETVVLASATGVEEADVAKIVDAQLKKIENAG